jgi:GAF domain-containing protein
MLGERMTKSVEDPQYLSPVVAALLPSQTAADRNAAAEADVRFELAVGIAEAIATLAGESGISCQQALAPLLSRIVHALPGAQCASLFCQPNRQKPAVTLVATGRTATELDELQNHAGHGPCLDAMSAAELIQVDDLATDPRWPELAKLERPLPIRSVLSVPVHTGDCGSQSLNLYAKPRYAFGSSQHSAAYLCGAALGLALTALHQRERAEHLRIALGTNRQIGTAMGILMARHRCSADEAFTALRVTSQHQHRKLREVADEVIYTGTLPSRRPPRALA